MRLIARRSRQLLPLVAAAFLAAPVSRADTPITQVGKKIDRFALKDSTGKLLSLTDFKDRKAVVVLFVGTQCPINNAFMPRLVELHKTYTPKGVQFLAINSNRQDDARSIAAHAKEHGLPFPVLRDEGAAVADRFGARRTPEAFVLDGKHTIRYQGRIDDQFGIGFVRPQPLRHDLALALDEVLAGKPVSQPTTPVAGCLIGRAPRPKAAAKLSYTKDVAPIIQNRCQECHRPGQIGPMPLLTYDDVSSWSEMIREVVREKRMPPWHAAPGHLKFKNDRGLSAEDRTTLLSWIDQGCPKGDERDLPAARKFADTWYIGKPDLVLTMPVAQTVPAKAPRGGVPYKLVRVKTDFKDDVWVQAAEAKPGNKSVVHHIIVYVLKDGSRRPGGLRDLDDGIGSGFLVGYAPGDLGVTYPAGAAKKIPKGATLVFQMHYTPNGVEQQDRSSVGLIFAKAPPKDEVKTKAIANYFLEIPPGAKQHKVTSSATLRKDTYLWSLLPHMHLRGKSFEYVAVHPDGKREKLLSVPQYDFGWQATYVLERPLRLPAGTRIECTAYYDNSTDNPNNPDPKRTVRWGQQTWEEMMIGFIDYSYADEPGKAEGSKQKAESSRQ
jgi:peroxiredoxin